MKTLIINLLVALPIFCFSQDQKATTLDGKAVILKSNGTWEFEKNTESKTKEINNDLSNCDYSTNEIDEFTGELKRFTKSQKIAKKFAYRYFVELRRIGDEYIIKSNYEGSLGCVSSDSKMIIKFIDSETIVFKNIGEIDCSNNAPMYFVINNDDFVKLNSTPLEKIRLNGSEGYIDLDIVQPNFFIQNLKCIEK